MATSSNTIRHIATRYKISVAQLMGKIRNFSIETNEDKLLDSPALAFYEKLAAKLRKQSDEQRRIGKIKAKQKAGLRPLVRKRKAKPSIPEVMKVINHMKGKLKGGVVGPYTKVNSNPRTFRAF